MKISTSILKVENPLEEIPKLERAGTDFIHLDVMDGNFVSNKKEYDELRVTKPLDIHFMVNDVVTYVDKYMHLNPEYMTFHIELDDTQKYINYIKSKGIKVGIAINPDTVLEKLIPYLDQIDLVLVMSVVPGKGGQQFMESTLPKIEKLRELKDKYHYVIEVDGGINEDTILKVAEIDLVVSGSYITNSNDYLKQIKTLKNKVK